MTKTSDNRSRLKTGCLIALVVFSAYLAIEGYSNGFWWWFLLFGMHAVVLLFLRVSWVIPLMMAGTYVGMFMPGPFGGTAESIMYDWAASILVCMGFGFGLGFLIEFVAAHRSRRIQSEQSQVARE